MSFLWVSIADLLSVGLIGGMFSPIDMMTLPQKGDRRLDYAVIGPKGDDEYILLECTDERATAIKDVLGIMGKRKSPQRRPIRTRITQDEPGPSWQRIPE